MIPMKYSIVILLKFENDDLIEFVANVDSLFNEISGNYEIIIIRNGPGSFPEDKKNELVQVNPDLRMFQLPVKTTEALCLTVGFKECCGDIILVFGSYQQISTHSIKSMIEALDEETDIVTPWRRKRIDSKSNQFQSKVYNRLVRTIVKSDFNDLGCKVKLLRRRILDNIEIYGNMYSFLPILAIDKGYRVKEIICEHFQDHRETGIRGIKLYLNKIFGILTFYFNSRFNRKPLRFFSTVGVAFILIGGIIFSYVFLEKLIAGTLIGQRPELLLSLLFAVIGIQAASVGLLGEIIAFVHGRHRKEYNIDRVL